LFFTVLVRYDTWSTDEEDEDEDADADALAGGEE
jgi:hypothetical protein